jgi:hypothetical protein
MQHDGAMTDTETAGQATTPDQVEIMYRAAPYIGAGVVETMWISRYDAARVVTATIFEIEHGGHVYPAVTREYYVPRGAAGEDPADKARRFLDRAVQEYAAAGWTLGDVTAWPELRPWRPEPWQVTDPADAPCPF